MKRAISYNWSAMIDELLMLSTPAAICDAMQMQCSNGVLRHYRLGVQPLYWRGELLLTFYEATTGKNRSQAPTCEVRRGHRVDRRLTPGPKLQSLPNWPAPQASVKPIKRKRVAA